MLKSFTIKNFRCFKYLTLEPLARVNLIGGVNNVGKTSVLEALFLYLGPDNPSLPISINIFRGIQPSIKFTDSKDLVLADTLWGWLFLGKNSDQEIELSSVNEYNLKQYLQIQLVVPAVSTSIAARNGESTIKFQNSTRAFYRHELLLKFQNLEQQEAVSRIFVTPNGIEWESAQLPPLPMAIFCYARGFPPKEDAERFSKLERVNRQGEILSALQPLEPRLKRLAVLVQGDIPIIAGDIGIGELVRCSTHGGWYGKIAFYCVGDRGRPKRNCSH